MDKRLIPPPPPAPPPTREWDEGEGLNGLMFLLTAVVVILSLLFINQEGLGR